MFKDPGSKMQTAAVINTIILWIAALVAGSYAIAKGEFLIGVVIYIGGGGVGYLLNLILYGLGVHFANTQYSAEVTSNILSYLKKDQKKEPGARPQRTFVPSHTEEAPQAGPGMKTCPKCGKVQPAGRARCIDCGEMFF